MALSTHTVSAYYLSVVFVIANAAASCDDINCVTCNTNDRCAECRGGYYINKERCYPCRGNCSSCKDTYFCTVCNAGFYTFESFYYTSCEKCPPDCVKCNSTAFCSECTPGHYGKRCGKSCNAWCKDGACSKTDCTHGCIDGYFQYYFPDNYSYCSVCTPNCKSCTNRSQCNTCHDGFHLINYNGGYACNPCDSDCKSCSTPSVCDSCVHGRWNSTCELYCPDGCKNNTCDVFTGLCNKGCAKNYYMTSDGVCYPCLQSSSGCHCPDFQYNNGSVCVPCNDKCYNPPNGSSICNNNGECLFGCRNGWSGRTCNTVDLTTETSNGFTTPLKTPVSTTVSEFTSSRPKQQTAEDEADVPVAVIAGSVGGGVFLLIIGACIGVLCTVLYFKRRNDTTCASSTDPSYGNTPDTNIEGISTYTDLCHVSGKETPYSTVTRTEYENMNV